MKFSIYLNRCVFVMDTAIVTAVIVVLQNRLCEKERRMALTENFMISKPEFLAVSQVDQLNSLR